MLCLKKKLSAFSLIEFSFFLSLWGLFMYLCISLYSHTIQNISVNIDLLRMQCVATEMQRLIYHDRHKTEDHIHKILFPHSKASLLNNVPYDIGEVAYCRSFDNTPFLCIYFNEKKDLCSYHILVMKKKFYEEKCKEIDKRIDTLCSKEDYKSSEICDWSYKNNVVYLFSHNGKVNVHVNQGKNNSSQIISF